jgi:hypothetical protein
VKSSRVTGGSPLCSFTAGFPCERERAAVTRCRRFWTLLPQLSVPAGDCLGTDFFWLSFDSSRRPAHLSLDSPARQTSVSPCSDSIVWAAPNSIRPSVRCRDLPPPEYALSPGAEGRRTSSSFLRFVHSVSCSSVQFLCGFWCGSLQEHISVCS